jgi:hypothetical protein
MAGNRLDEPVMEGKMKHSSILTVCKLACLVLIGLLLALSNGTALARPERDASQAGSSKIFLPVVVKSGPGLVPLTPQCIECPKNISFGTGRSLHLDSLGHPHISFGGDHLYHAWNDGSAWHTETVDSSPGVGYYSALAFDNTGKLAIAYLDDFNHALKLARWSGSAWNFQVIDTTNGSNTSSALLFDNSNNPLLAYVAGNLAVGYQVKFARWTGSTWSISIVDTGIDADHMASVSMAMDKSGSPHISYFRNDSTRLGGLIYASQSGNAWTLQIVDDNDSNGNANSLAFDSQGVPHISYYNDWDEVVQYASWNKNASKWDIELAWIPSGVIVERTSATSLTFGSGDVPMITVSLGDSCDPYCLVWLVYKGASGFVHSLVSDMYGQARWPSIALGSDGKPCISYIDFMHGQLRYARLTAWGATPDANTWTNEGLDTGAQVGQGVSVAMDRFGQPHVAYMDLTNGLIKYATQAVGVWKTSVVNIPGMKPAHGLSLAVDQLGRPHIAYSDMGAQKLMYASLTASGWTAEVVANDSAGMFDLEKYISLALDASDQPHILFYNQLGINLSHYYKSGSAWQVEQVDKDSSGITGLYNAMAIDSAGHIHVSYQDNYTAKLMYAYWNGSGWAHVVANDTYTGGMNTSIVVDSANHPHICHSDIIDYYLMYDYYDGSNWIHETLTPSSKGLADSRQPVCSIEIGPGNVPYITYFDRISRHLTLKHKVGASWVTETLDSSGDNGEHNSLAMFTGIPFVGYYHGSNKDLMFVEWKP